MYFLYTLLQALDRDADLDDPDAIDELRVVSVEVATQMVTDDKVIQVFGISNKLLGTENQREAATKENTAQQYYRGRTG